MRIGFLLRMLALVLVAALAAVLVYRFVDGSGSGVARAAKEHQEPPLPKVSWNVMWRATAWPGGLHQPSVGTDLSFAKLRGHPAVINFWSSWCGPCKLEAPVLAAAATKNAKHVVFVGVDVSDNTSDARHFLSQNHIPYLVVQGDSDALPLFGVVGLPETFYVDSRGRIQDVTAGQVTDGILRRELRSLS
jgi:cytochrome c biogenesis protein CcmG/thiol:disulfide interchange protein DsbE